MKLILLIIGIILVALGALPSLTALGLPTVILTTLAKIPTFSVKPFILIVAGVIALYFGIRG